MASNHPGRRTWTTLNRQVIRQYLASMEGEAANTIRLDMTPVIRTSCFMHREFGMVLTLDNIQTVRFALTAAPVGPATSLTVVVNRAIVTTLPAPPPKDLYVTRSKDGWQVSPTAPEFPAERLHYPGGAMALFHGEPLMVA